MEGIELILFEIITAVGEARSNYIEAINLAREGKFNEAEKLVKEGQLSFVKGHKRHADLVQKTAAGEKIEADIFKEYRNVSGSTGYDFVNTFFDRYLSGRCISL